MVRQRGIRWVTVDSPGKMLLLCRFGPSKLGHPAAMADVATYWVYWYLLPAAAADVVVAAAAAADEAAAAAAAAGGVAAVGIAIESVGLGQSQDRPGLCNTEMPLETCWLDCGNLWGLAVVALVVETLDLMLDAFLR